MPDPRRSSRPMAGVVDAHPSPERPKPRVPDHDLIRHIGGGAYGDVWLARNVVGTYRAVKVVYSSSFHDASPYEREYRGIRKFEPISRSNDGFVDILQIGRNDEEGYFYYVMELADDASNKRGAAPCNWDTYSPRTLRTEVQCRGRLPFEECLHLVMSLNLALGQLHRQGLIHRDIKPSNIIFVGGVPKLADIGLVTDVQEARSFVGTEGFIPPEGPNSPQADIYSLGKVLYEMSMGKDRLDFPEPFTALGQVTGSQELEELNTIILKACAIAPETRYQSAEEMQVDLALLHSGRSVKSRRILERRLAFARKAGVVIGVVAAVAFAAYLYQQFQTREARRLAQAEVFQRTRAEALLHQAQLKEAETYFERDDAGTAVAHLARMLRQNPMDHLAAMRLQSALTDRSFALPIRVFEQDMELRDADISPDGERIVLASGNWSDRGEARIYNARTGQLVGKPLSHGKFVATVRFSPDGRYIATGSLDRTARIWDATTGEPVSAPLSLGETDWWPDFQAVIWLVEFSPDGEHLIIADWYRTRTWKVPTGEPLGPEIDHGMNRLFSVEFSPDGRRFLASTHVDLTVKLWNSDTGLLEKTLALDASGASAQFSPDGNQILSAGGTVVRLWNIDSGEIVLEIPHEGIVSPDDSALTDFSPDGLRIASTDDLGTVRLWNARTGHLLLSSIRHKSDPRGLCFDPTGERLLTWERRRARVWDSRSGRPLTEWLPHSSDILTAQFDFEGSRVLVTTTGGGAVLWDVRPGKALHVVLRHGTHVPTARFSPDGMSVLTAAGGEIHRRFWNTRFNEASIWDAFTGERKRPGMKFSYTHNVQYAEFSPDGELFVTAHSGGEVRVWNTQSGAAVTEPLRHTRARQGDVHSARFSPDGRRVVSVSQDGTGRVWDARTGQPLTEPVVFDFEGDAQLTSAEFSPDGHWVLTVSVWSREAQVWDSFTGEKKWKLRHDGFIKRARYSPTGDRIATASSDGTARLWDCRSGQPLDVVLRHQGEVWSVCFSPDGRWVVTAADDHTARLWDAETGTPIGNPMQHQGPVIVAEFSRDGRWVVTGSVDGTARVWDAQTGRPLTEPFRHDGPVGHAEFSPDSHRIVTGSTDFTARVLELPLATVTVPDWMADLAEAVAGQRMGDNGDPAPVTPAQFFAVKDRILSMAGTNQHGAWARWLLADRFTRTTSPSSRQTADQYLNRLIESEYWSGREGLPEFIRLNPSHAEATARLAEAALTVEGLSLFSLSAVASTSVQSSETALAQEARMHKARIQQATFLAERALQLDPEEPHAWRAKARVLAESGRPAEALEAVERALTLKPDFGGAWTLKGEWLEHSGRIEEALVAFTHAVECSASSTNSNPRGMEAFNTALLNRARVLERLGRIEESAADNLRGRDISARDPQAKANLIDLSSRYNRALGDELSVLPRGIQLWGGVPFDVRGAIRFGGGSDVTNAVRGIRVGQRCQRLHFLHAANIPAWPDRGGTRIGTYTVRYADGTHDAIPIVLGKTIGLFMRNSGWADKGGEGGDAKVAVWLDTETTLVDGKSTRLLQLSWDNPHPGRAITSIDAEWWNDSDITGHIVLVAITAQSERTPWISRHPQPQTVAEGDTVDFTVDAEGEHPLEYQWQFNGEDLPGATNAILTLSAAAARHSGNYAVRVRHATADSLITVTSRAADLVVTNDRIFYGVLRREMYFDITEKSLGALTNHVRFPENPDASDFIHRFETPSDVADHYGVRVTGYLIPPRSGDYRFFLCSREEGALFLSTDESAMHKQWIAAEPVANSAGMWTTHFARPVQENRSAAIRLEEGRRYYVEALMKTGRGEDNLAVTWQLPGEPPPENFAPPIPGTYLAAPSEWLNQPHSEIGR